MRLRQRDLITVYVKKYKPAQDPDGTIYADYEDSGSPIKASIQPAGGKAMAETYGQRLAYMLTMRYEGNEAIFENDGICVNVASNEKPDYKVVAIQPWVIKTYILEKV